MKPVLSKRDFVKRYREGEFGNASPTWGTLEEFQSVPERLGLFHIRNRVAGGPTWYNIPASTVAYVWGQLLKRGIPTSSLYISAMAPTEKTLFQGEVQQGLWGLDLTYTTVAKPMRDALQEETKYTRGLVAHRLLRWYLDDNSFIWLQHLLGEYPDHVVEFSTYSTCWGTVPGYNTVFWEIRKY